MRSATSPGVLVCVMMVLFAGASVLALPVDEAVETPADPTPSGPGWMLQNSGTSRTLMGVMTVAIPEGIAVGERSGMGGPVIRRTTDAGNNWQGVSNSLPSSLDGLDFVGTDLGWAVGGSGLIANTSDGGLTWGQQFLAGSPNDILRGVDFVDPATGWAAGNVFLGGQATQILATTDGGATWAAQLQKDGVMLAGVSFADTKRGWAAGEAGSGQGVIYNTSDGGSTWAQQPTPFVNPLTDIEFLDARTGYAVGFNGVFLRTSDGGATWVPSTITPGVNFNALDFVSPTQGWVVGQNGNVYVTYDGGISWSKQSSGTSSELLDVSFVDDMHGWAVGWQGTVIRTNDGGGLPADRTGPNVNITEPVDGSFVNGTVLIRVNATDNVAVTRVEMRIDGLSRWNDTSAPYEFQWNTSTEVNGPHTLNATAYDAAGNRGYDEISVVVDNAPSDSGPPMVAITSPNNNDIVSGSVTVRVNATDDVAVVNVTLRMDNVTLGVDPSAPYEFTWDTTSTTDGVHRLNDTGIDPSLKEGYDDIWVRVANAPDLPPTVRITSPKDGATVSGTVTISAEAMDDTGIAYVEFRVDDTLVSTDPVSPYSYDWDTLTVSNGKHTLNATAYDLLGQNASDRLTVTVDNGGGGPDTTPPLVAISSPGDGASVTGPVRIRALAMDDVGVSRVEFSIDGSVRASDTTAPYEHLWDTSAEGPGQHTITATAYDASDNHASDTITVSIPADGPPSVGFLSPAEGSTVAKGVTIVLDPKDDRGILYVRLSVDGSEVANLTAHPYTYLWDTTTTSDGGHTLSAVAVDTASQSSQEVSVNVTVDNAGTPPPSNGGGILGAGTAIPLWVLLLLVALIIILVVALVAALRRSRRTGAVAPPSLTFERGVPGEERVETEAASDGQSAGEGDTENGTPAPPPGKGSDIERSER